MVFLGGWVFLMSEVLLLFKASAGRADLGFRVKGLGFGVQGLCFMFHSAELSGAPDTKPRTV